MQILWMCNYCRFKNPNGYGCKAFGDKIPDEIVTGDILHLKPIEGDNGIHWQPKSAEHIPREFFSEEEYYARYRAALAEEGYSEESIEGMIQLTKLFNDGYFERRRQAEAASGEEFDDYGEQESI